MTCRNVKYALLITIVVPNNMVAIANNVKGGPGLSDRYYFHIELFLEPNFRKH